MGLAKDYFKDNPHATEIISEINNLRYCMNFKTEIIATITGVPEEVIENLLNSKDLVI